MGVRLEGFDYSLPYFYMVTLKCLPKTAPLSAIVAPGRCELNPITRAFVKCIRHFHEECTAIAPIECFTIMPDHIHLLIRIIENDQHIRLEVIVSRLMVDLERLYHAVTQIQSALFEPYWHDWIVMKNNQLKTFTRYIRENPARHWLRKSHPEYFQRVNAITFLDRTWYGYGNPALLQLPVIEPFQCSRKWAQEGEEWRQAVSRASRIGPGGAGIGTFMSPCEKACGNAINHVGGRWIILYPEGFGERWHPSRQHELLCAQGRMLFLSLYPAMERKPTTAELYQRCHEMGNLIVEGLQAQRL